MKLVSERILTVRSEGRLHHTLVTVEELRRLNDLYKRGNIKKDQLQIVLKRILNR